VGQVSNFTKAAVQLQVAQPALSRQVKALEDEIGVELLRRSARGVTLTSEGRLFLKDVCQLLKHTGESSARNMGEAGAPSQMVNMLKRHDRLKEYRIGFVRSNRDKTIL
jgi:LysR family transcriptional regulator, nitrogen assimilation regulatory protein